MTSKLQPSHLKCLLALGELLGPEASDEGFYTGFAPVMEITKLERKEVRRIIRLLKRKGLTEFSSGLCDYDGEFKGSGYRPTEEGWKIIKMEVAKNEKN